MSRPIPLEKTLPAYGKTSPNTTQKAENSEEFREFVRNEFEYVDKHPNIYDKVNKRDKPTERRKANTVANEMQVLRAFFTELEDTEEINRSPLRFLDHQEN